MLSSVKAKALEFYEKNETKVDLGFFLGGFVFDIFTLSSIDDPFSIAQQVAYLLIIGLFLYHDFLLKCGKWQPSPRWQTIWNYRSLIVHFLLGSLLSVYSLFYLKSSSIFSSIVFVVVLLILMVANELKQIQRSEVNIKIALYVICLFSFYSLIVPVALGFVGWVPFLLSISFTALTLGLVFKKLQSKVQDSQTLLRFLMAPTAGVLSLFLVFYYFGWIPPVPISINNMGVYHNLEVINGTWNLKYERPWYKFWQSGAQDFIARPGDRVLFFVQIYSPSRFDDGVILDWARYDDKRGWLRSDRIPIRIVGGRKEGFRGYTYKQNFTDGQWRVKVETTDGREIGRLHFDVTKTDEVLDQREWKVDTF